MVCTVNYLHFLYSLGNFLVAPFFAYNGQACNAQPSLGAKNRELSQIFSIYIIDIWSEKVEKLKHKRRNTNNNIKWYNVQNTKCKVQNRKSDFNCKFEYSAFLYLFSIFRLSFLFFSLTSVSHSQLGVI